MSHNEKRGHWTKEGLISMGTGVLFGATYVAFSHPFDTTQTKMQAGKGFEGSNLVNSLVKIVKTEGIKGFYRGVVPPLWGSGVYRSIQFSAFEATYTYLDNDFGKKQIPFTKGLELRVILGGIMSGTCRSLVETPLEYAKIQRQMLRSYLLKDCYTGLTITWARACVLMPVYFISLDSCRRHFNSFFSNNALGPFLISGFSGVLGWWACWPLENMSIFERMKFIVNERGGFFALYRGLSAGTLKCFVGNGFGMVALIYAQKKITEWGFRK